MHSKGGSRYRSDLKIIFCKGVQHLKLYIALTKRINADKALNNIQNL